MTPLADLKTQRAALEAAITSIDAQIAALPKEWPQVGDLTWTVSSDGFVIRDCWDNLGAEQRRLEMGMIFRTKHAAEQHAKRLRLMAEARAEGMVGAGEMYWHATLGFGILGETWHGESMHLAYFRSGNYARTREGMEDKVRRYGARFILGYDDEEGE